MQNTKGISLYNLSHMKKWISSKIAFFPSKWIMIEEHFLLQMDDYFYFFSSLEINLWHYHEVQVWKGSRECNGIKYCLMLKPLEGFMHISGQINWQAMEQMDASHGSLSSSTLRPEPNGERCAEYTLKCIIFKENFRVAIATLFFVH